MKRSEFNDQEQGLDVIVAIVLFPVAILSKAFVLTYLWAWFVMPFGLQALGLAHAFGLSVAIKAMSGATISGDDDAPLTRGPLIGIILSFMSLGIGAIAHAFMG